PYPDEGTPFLSISILSIFIRKTKVKKQLLKEVAANDRWHVNNKYDRSHTPLTVKEIIRRAKQYIDKEVTFDVFFKNCEHFVTMLRYGEGISDQANTAIGRIVDAVSAIAAAVIRVSMSGSKSKREK
ncbi:PREDICTED: phospholipid-metabolizing enzyme A-C1-like, partial [Acanthisitta chloris]|uniref:phospholipid-metabolizing enzyme A-C1-like n=1 Tax=Acanthisitta chloris TaxID=57068 RepID=UPI0004F0CBEF